MKTFGWIPPDSRSPEVKRTCEAITLEMPRFRLIGDYKAGEKADLSSCVKTLRGKHLPSLYQQIGSCVGHGLTKAEWYLQYVEIVRLGDKEEAILPYEPYNYAQSRKAAGISGNEDGSTGAGAAKAAKQYGVLSSKIAGLPAFKSTDSVVIFPGATDKSWGKAGSPSQYVAEGVKHLVKTTALMRSADDVAKAIQNYYPVVICSDWGGLDKPPVKGGVLLNEHVTAWNHCMAATAWRQHLELGEIFRIENSWGPDAHGTPPDDSPMGTFWVLKKDMEYIVKQGDSYAYSAFDGFPAQADEIDRKLFDLIGRQD